VGEAIVKAAKGRDLYLIWSSVVENAIWVGDRTGLLEHLHGDGQPQYPGIPSAEDRIVRADETGSSAVAPPAYGWDDKYLRVMEGSPSDGWYHIRRDRLPAYAEALLRGDDAAAVALLECWQRIEVED
jgi:hypothetical protein